MIKFLAGLTACFVVLCAGYAIASRNSVGTMSAISGPYVAGTVINPTTINSRYSDIETEITDSLSRSGKGGMTAALRGADGTVASPAFSFTSETGTGMYRIGASDLGWALGGSKKLELNATGLAITGTLGVGVAASGAQLDVEGATDATKGTLFVKGIGGHGDINIDTDTPATKEAGVNFYKGGVFKAEVYVPANSSDLRVFTGAADRLIVNASGVTIGASGTAISGSFAASAGWVPGSIGAGSSNGTSIVVTGAALGSPCVIGTPTPNPNLVLTCYVTANSCNLLLGNPSAGALTGSSGTYQCRVFNP